jgi:hypothetical protein
MPWCADTETDVQHITVRSADVRNLQGIDATPCAPQVSWRQESPVIVPDRELEEGST